MAALSVPLKMVLVEVGTREEMAHLQGSWVWPWSVKQDNITLVGPRREPMWVRIVIASGMAEASRMSRRRTNTSKASTKARSTGSVCGLISVKA